MIIAVHTASVWRGPPAPFVTDLKDRSSDSIRCIFWGEPGSAAPRFTDFRPGRRWPALRSCGSRAGYFGRTPGGRTVLRRRAAFRPARNASEGEGGLYVDHTATMRSNTLSSASRGSEHTPLCTGDIWMTVLRGATSQ